MQGGVTHDCASILDSIAKGTSCFHYFAELCRVGLHMIVLVYLIVLLRELLVSTTFCMVHPYIAIHSVE